jgi:cellobiose phosphorylase
MAGDIYGVAPHRGRGGWSWYTGAAGWMYRLGIEALLGLRQRGDELEIRPCIPPSWPGCRVRLRRGRALYRISMRNLPVIGSAADQQPVDRRVQVSVAFDGEAIAGCVIPFVDDGKEHEVEVALESLPKD